MSRVCCCVCEPRVRGGLRHGVSRVCGVVACVCGICVPSVRQGCEYISPSPLSFCLLHPSTSQSFLPLPLLSSRPRSLILFLTLTFLLPSLSFGSAWQGVAHVCCRVGAACAEE